MLTNYSVKKPWSLIVIMIIVIILGVISYINTPVDLLPNVNLPYVAVATVRVGASPEAIERDITTPTEEALMTVGGIKNVTSMSMEHFSIIILEFESTVNIDNVVVDVRESLNMMSASSQIQDTASMATEGISTGDDFSSMLGDMQTEPMIIKMNPSMMPVMMLSMGYEGASANESSAAMKKLITKIEGVEGVASVTAQGLVQDLILMQLSGDNLLSVMLPSLASAVGNIDLGAVSESDINALSGAVSQILTPQLLSTMLFAQNINMPIGTVTAEDGLSYFVKVGGESYESAQDLKDVPIISINLEPYITKIKSSPLFAQSKLSMEDLGEYISSLTKGIEGTENLALNMINMLVTAELPEEIKSILTVTDVDKEATNGKYIKQDGKYVVYDPDKATHVGQTRYNAPNIKFNDVIFNMFFGDNGIIEKDLGAQNYVATLTLGAITNMFELDTSGDVLTSLNGESTVSLTIMKQTNAATTDVSKGVLKVLDNEKKQDGNFFYVSMFDQGFYINEIVTSALSNMLVGGLLAIAILFLFLKRIKPTFVVGISIAISVVLTFVLMYFSGITLNVVSMGGLALGVGMLVDNSIIVIENIYRQKRLGKDPKQAAIDGTKQILGAIISSTITTVIIFVPIFFVQGLVKEIFKDMALTITYSLLASLLFSITLVPTAATTILKNDQEKPAKYFDKFRNFYTRCLSFSLNKRWITTVAVIVLLAGSVVCAAFMPRELFPMQSSGYLTATLEINVDKIPEGKTLDEVMLETIDHCNDVLLPNGQPLDYISYVNISQSTDLLSSMAGLSMGTGGNSLSVSVLKNTKTKLSDKEIAVKLNDALKSEDGLYNIDVSAQEDMANIGALLGDAVSVYVYCEDLDKLQDVVKQATKIANEVEGVKEASSSLDKLQLEYKLVVDRKKASKYGLTVAQVMLATNNALVSKGKTTSVQFAGDYEATSLVFYPSDYIVLEWVKTYDADDNYVKVYTDKDGSYYVLNSSAEAVEYKAKNNSFVSVPSGGKIPVIMDKITGSDAMTFSYTTTGDTVVAFETGNVVKYFYSALPKDNFDFMTCVISNNLSSLGMDMNLSGLVGVEEIELWKVLDDSCFIKDANGNTIWVDANGNVVDESAAGARPQGIIKTPGYFSVDHVNGKRYIAITGTLEDGYDIDSVSSAIKKRFDSEINFAAYDSSYDFQGQMMLITETFNTVYLVLGLGVVLIYLVMVAQFQSLKSPLIVMFTIPLALSGCIFSLAITGMSISAPALIGAVILVGIIVNNGIVFVDYANQMVEEGMPVKDALIKTGHDRLRPIMMTAFTTIIGMATMAMDTTSAGAMIRPMAIAAMGGLFYASLLTLFVVPVMYSFLNAHRDNRSFRKNPPKAYPSDFTKEDIEAYESSKTAVITPEEGLLTESVKD